MADPQPAAAAAAAPKKFLSYSAILCLAANTMNGPGITTLPDVAADAGLTLYVALIALSVTMAAFVCRRMVYAMWASLDDDEGVVVGAVGGSGKGGEYDSMKKVESGLMIQSLGIIDGSDDADAALEKGAGEVDEIIPGPTSGKDNEDHLTHREHHDRRETTTNATTTNPAPAEEEHTESEALFSQKEHDDNVAVMNEGMQQPSLERTSIVGQSREAYGKKTSVYVAVIMGASALALALGQMMLCAAILDGMFVALGGKSCALGWPSIAEDGDPSSWIHCTEHSSMKPFAGSGAPVSLISVGWVIAASASVAMGTVDLDEMMGVQYFLFGCLVVSAMRFSFVLKGMADGLADGAYDLNDGDERMLAAEEVDGSDSIASSAVNWFVGPNPFQTVGPIMFNFAFVVTSPPSSALAKKESVAYKALAMSCVVMGSMYVMVGLSGASVSNAVRNGMIKGGDDSNLLSLILLSGGDDGPSMFDLLMIALYGFSSIASVPVYCLLAKETLIYDAGVPPLPSFLLSNVLPWILVALTYNAAFFEAFVNWSGLLILGYANFSIPLLMDLTLKKVRASKAKMVRKDGDDEKTTSITKGVFILVTASITLVIVMSIANSLTLAVVASLLTAGLMTKAM